MDIYLIQSPEYSLSAFNEVADLLDSFEGRIRFIRLTQEKVSQRQSGRLVCRNAMMNEAPFHKTPYSTDLGDPLSWREFFDQCDEIRELFEIDEEAIVILLTHIENSLNWFSAYDKHSNAFVHTRGWDLFTNASPCYPIAYEISANILRILMKIEFRQIGPYCHENALGCMNDFCLDKRQIMLKLRTADICSDCLKRLHDQNPEPGILGQVTEIFEGIREQLLFLQGFKRQMRPARLVVTSWGRIMIPELGQLEIKLAPLFKVLYIFLLRHPEGVPLVDLVEYREELLKLYRKLATHENEASLVNRINDLTDPLGNSFNEKKAKINKEINIQLGALIAEHYQICGQAGQAFHINIPGSLVELKF